MHNTWSLQGEFHFTACSNNRWVALINNLLRSHSELRDANMYSLQESLTTSSNIGLYKPTTIVVANYSHGRCRSQLRDCFTSRSRSLILSLSLLQILQEYFYCQWATARLEVWATVEQMGGSICTKGFFTLNSIVLSLALLSPSPFLFMLICCSTFTMTPGIIPTGRKLSHCLLRIGKT